jgi:hypothetical protein
MTQTEIKNLITERRLEIIKEFGDQAKEENDEILLNWFTQEFFFGEITRQELDAFASEMGYEVQIDFGISNDEKEDKNIDA